MSSSRILIFYVAALLSGLSAKAAAPVVFGKRDIPKETFTNFMEIAACPARADGKLLYFTGVLRYIESPDASWFLYNSMFDAQKMRMDSAIICSIVRKNIDIDALAAKGDMKLVQIEGVFRARRAREVPPSVGNLNVRFVELWNDPKSEPHKPTKAR